MSAGYIEVPGICQRVLRVLRPTRGAPQPETTRHAAMDHGPPSQNGPPAKKAKKKVVQALLDFTSIRFCYSIRFRRWIYYSVDFLKTGSTKKAKVVKDLRGTPKPWPKDQKNLLA